MTNYVTLPPGSLPYQYKDENRVRRTLRVGDPIEATHPVAQLLSARMVAWNGQLGGVAPVSLPSTATIAAAGKPETSRVANGVVITTSSIPSVDDRRTGFAFDPLFGIGQGRGRPEPEDDVHIITPTTSHVALEVESEEHPEGDAP